MRDVSVFDDPRNVQCGKARVIWAEQTTITHRGQVGKGEALPAGWVLPGGNRVLDRQLAVDAAVIVDRLHG